ncbi:MAG TPA: proton-conducting transporter membrane subunit [Vicinamibacterales bacterium]|nr:proton-conducting transporter membrane subunit [Vicinamibacterales bacterium]
MPLAIAIRLATVAATLALARRPSASRLVALGGSIVASAITLAVAVGVIRSGDTVDGILARHAASGIVLEYAVTPLSAWFLIVLGLVAIPVALYSTGYFAHAVARSRTAMVGAGFNVLLGALETVFVAGGVFTFLFAWELMTLATSALVATDHEDAASRRAAYLYLVMSHVGTGCLVAGFLILASASDSSSFAVLLPHLAPGPMRHVLFVLFFLGFGVKAGIVPLHVWLPEAHPAAPSSISALMSAVLITAGIYGIFKVCAFGLGTPHEAWGLTVMGVGTLSAILGVLYALTQNDLKRLLAYSTIENAGIMLIGLGAGMTALAYGRGELAALGVAASLLHVLNHAVFKGLLFLAAGGVVMATGTRMLEQFGGLLRRMPWTGLCFLIGAMAISGLPPLNGFASEWLTFQALLLGFSSVPDLTRLNFPFAGALLALTTALAAACFVKAFGIGFLALPRSQAADDAHESRAVMLIPQAFLAVMCLGLGLFPGVTLRTLNGVLTSLPGVAPHDGLAPSPVAMVSGQGAFDHVVPLWLGMAVLGGVAIATVVARARLSPRRAPTWGCGGELTARTEYTATAFSKPLMMIFRAVYRPTREVEALAEISPYFPREVRYRAAIEPTFERYVYEPLTRAVLRAANGMKVLQAGSLHAYLAYVLLLGVLLLIWLGGVT